MFEKQNYVTGDVIYYEGESIDYLYLLEKGEIEIKINCEFDNDMGYDPDMIGNKEHFDFKKLMVKRGK